MRRMSGSKLALGAAVLLALAGGTYALGASSGGRITACVRHNSGTLYKARHCAKHDAKLSWNAAGPPGAQGTEGQRGPQGLQGSTGPAGPVTGILPAGVTLRGVFALAAALPAGTTTFQPISFGLQTTKPPTVHVINPGVSPPAGCSGSVANPGADSGNLCIFEGAFSNGTLIEIDLINHAQNSATTFGGAMELTATVGDASGNGSWAVTG